MALLGARPAFTPGLYVVATPIGNLGDITLRALDCLKTADLILAEDKRVTANLLNAYDIRTPMRAYHQHNEAAMQQEIVEKLRAGAIIALVSDAGTPLVSDPGAALVDAVIAAGLPVTALPGASAVLTALILSGLPRERFYFEGFLPAKSGERRRRIRDLSAIPATLVFYEAPHRTPETLEDLAAILGNRQGVMARELTKKFETIRRGLLPILAAEFAAEGAPKGEVVILVEPPAQAAELDDAGIDSALQKALQAHSPRDAVAIVAAELGLPKRRVYARALTMQNGHQDE
jgi:16S rRNA (cytidine1402-2'-O)-methyltransferase